MVEPVKTWHNANHLDGAQNQCCSSKAHDISRANNIKIHPHYPWPISTLNPSKSDGLHPPHIPNHITNYVLIHLLHFPPPPLPAQLWPPFPSKPSSDSVSPHRTLTIPAMFSPSSIFLLNPLPGVSALLLVSSAPRSLAGILESLSSEVVRPEGLLLRHWPRAASRRS